MRFPYIEREAVPLPGIPGSDREWEPQITVRVGGPKSLQLVPGLLDTGAVITIIPLRYLEKLGSKSVGKITLFGSGTCFTAQVARVDLQLHSARTIHTWSAFSASALAEIELSGDK